MKILIYLLFAVSVFGQSYIDRVQTTQSSHLIQYLPMNEPSGTTSYDSSGNGRNGTYYNCAVNIASGNSNGVSVYFNNVSSRLEYYSSAVNTAFNRDEGSVMIWFYPTTWVASANKGIIYLYEDASNYVAVGYNGDKISSAVMCNGESHVDSVLKSNVDQTYYLHWFNIVVTWSKAGNFTKTYVNGSMIDSVSTFSGLTSTALNSAYSKIGSVNGSAWADGLMQHYALWSIPLTKNEIKNLATIRTPSFLCYGNSITAGTNTTLWARYPNLIAKEIGTFNFKNSGISGTTLQNTNETETGLPRPNNGVDRLRRDVLNYEPDTVIIQYGINDMLKNDANYTLQTFINDYDDVIDTLTANGIPDSCIIVGGLTLCDGYSGYAPPFNGGSEAKNIQYNAALRNLATLKSVRFANNYDTMVAYGGADILTADGLHPTDSGYVVLAKNLLHAPRLLPNPSATIRSWTLTSTGLGLLGSFFPLTGWTATIEGVSTPVSITSDSTAILSPVTPLVPRSTGYALVLINGSYVKNYTINYTSKVNGRSIAMYLKVR